MSRTFRQKPPVGKEYWKSRLYCGGETTGPKTKKLTHRKERHVGKQICRNIGGEK